MHVIIRRPQLVCTTRILHLHDKTLPKDRKEIDEWTYTSISWLLTRIKRLNPKGESTENDKATTFLLIGLWIGKALWPQVGIKKFVLDILLP